MTDEDFTELPTSLLVQRTVDLARSEPVLQSEDYWAHVRVVHFRSGRDVFDEALGLCSSSDAICRAVGADILAQLGVRDGVAVFPFADDSAGPLVALLSDMEPTVIASALYALGTPWSRRTSAACITVKACFGRRSSRRCVCSWWPPRRDLHSNASRLVHGRRHGHSRLGDVRSRCANGRGLSRNS